MELTDVLYKKEEGIATVTINRPNVLNALRAQTYIDLIAAFRDAVEDDEVGVMILTGAGDRAFSSGGDVKGQAVRKPGYGRKYLYRLMEIYGLLRNSGKPTIAAVNGYSIGAGHELHLICDITIAAEDAVFGQVGPRVGSVPIWGATQILPRLVGEKRAREIIFLCRQYSAKEAYEMGLVNKVVPRDQLMGEVNAWAKEILDKSPQSLRIAKTSLNFASDLLYSSYTHGIEMLALMYGNPENMEGVTAFLEKRKPNYRKFRKSDVEVKS
ncbi:MAG: enoyl-CoA hydratase/isomerase family protein [Betaproteobacteria bacterium]|nr:enoyl-CoA hydratase/isomerase family protein [Betaproteobacteria bacterium]